MSSSPSALLDPSIFADLEAKVDEETQVRDALGQMVQRLDRAVAAAQGLLSRVHSTPRSRCASSPPPPDLALLRAPRRPPPPPADAFPSCPVGQIRSSWPRWKRRCGTRWPWCGSSTSWPPSTPTTSPSALSSRPPCLAFGDRQTTDDARSSPPPQV